MASAVNTLMSFQLYLGPKNSGNFLHKTENVVLRGIEEKEPLGDIPREPTAEPLGYWPDPKRTEES
jgi:hypothetical protein